MRGLSLVVASGDHSSSRCTGLSPSRPLLLRSTGSRRAGSVIVAHGPSRSAACGIFPDQGWNPCPLHWQADSQPLRHQGSPQHLIFKILLKGYIGFIANNPFTYSINNNFLYSLLLFHPNAFYLTVLSYSFKTNAITHMISSTYKSTKEL